MSKLKLVNEYTFSFGREKIALYLVKLLESKFIIVG